MPVGLTNAPGRPYEKRGSCVYVGTLLAAAMLRGGESTEERAVKASAGTLEALSREVGVEIYRLEDWRDRAVAGLERGVQARQGDLVAETLDAATRHIGELSMENERLRERARAAEQRRP